MENFPFPANPFAEHPDAPSLPGVDPSLPAWLATEPRRYPLLARQHDRAERSMARLGRWNAIAAAVALFSLALAAVQIRLEGGAPPNPLRPYWPIFGFDGHYATLWSTLGWLAIAHVVAALPLQIAWQASRAIDRVRRGERDDAERQHMLAVPWQPRPLYFHLIRAAVRPIAIRTVEATVPTAAIYGAAVWVGFGWGFLGYGAKEPAPVGMMLIGHVVVGGAMALAGSWLASQLVELVVGAQSGLGALSRFAIAGELSHEAAALVGEEEDLDERWGEAGLPGWLSFAGCSIGKPLLVVAILPTVVALQSGIVAISVVAGELLGSFFGALVFVAGEFGFAALIGRFAAWLKRTFPKAFAA